MHVEKVKLAGGNFARLVKHMRREHKYYKNNVDLDKSNMNISLKDYTTDLKKFIESKGVTRIRKDAVGAYNVVCTVAKEDKEYLADEIDYKRWGWAVIDATLKNFNLSRDDVVGAEIHLDETSPHLHFSFVPLLREGDKTTLSAKRIGNKRAFKDLHDVLQSEMELKGYKGRYVNAEGVRGLSKDKLEEYKKAQEVIQKMQKELEAYKTSNEQLKMQNERLSKENVRIAEDVKELQAVKEELSKLSFFEKIAVKKIKRYEEAVAEKNSTIEQLNNQITDLSSKVNKSPSVQLLDENKKLKYKISSQNKRIEYLENSNAEFVKQINDYEEQLNINEEKSKSGLDIDEINFDFFDR